MNHYLLLGRGSDGTPRRELCVCPVGETHDVRDLIFLRSVAGQPVNWNPEVNDGTGTRGLTFKRYAQAFGAGARAAQRGGDMDAAWDAYCGRLRVSYRSPLGNAWMDGWVNADNDPQLYLAGM